jgi:hypothetical protein
MSTGRGRVQMVLAAGLMLVGLTCVYSVLMASPEEPAGCQNETCKEIAYHLNCDKQVGGKFDLKSCNLCADPVGRCKDGNTSTCGRTSVPLGLAFCDVTEVCLCANNPSSAPFVEATGNYSGDYKDSGVTRKVCVK